MEFEPTIVYKDKGHYQRPGGTFDYKGVSTKEQFDAALAAGWLASYAEIFGPVAAVEDDAAMPTRDELEQKAKELGIKFDGRTTDKRLSELVANKLQGI